jgi:hypothetical protein
MRIVYDLECYPNFFCYVGYSIDEDRYYTFEISEFENDLLELQKHLRQVKVMIGFNNLSYDYQLIHSILTEHPDYISLHDLSDNLINNDDRDLRIPEWKVLIPQLDLFKLWHFDNKARRKSLKDVEIFLEAESVEVLPIDPFKYVTKEESETLKHYCVNDVKETFRLYQYSKDEIDIRKKMTKIYKFNMMNKSDSSLGETILLLELAKAHNMNLFEYRKTLQLVEDEPVVVKDLMFDYINFKNKELNEVLDFYKSSTIYDGEINKSIVFKDVKYDFGLGGVHAVLSNGVFESCEDNVIISSDVVSYYPNLAIKNKFYPRQIGEIFCNVYEGIFKRRKQYPKNTPENYCFKIALNSVFGKSKDKYSILRDPVYLYKTTINGQFLLVMLTEWLSEIGQPLMVNTDGCEMMIKRSDLDKYMLICKKWEQITGLELEHKSYKKLCIRDVNNYIGIHEDGSVYPKGEFDEISPYSKMKTIHKDPSHRIISRALQKYFSENIPVEQTIMSSNNVFDFMIAAKVNSGMKLVHRNVVDFDFVDTIYDKTLRYVISNNGGYLYRKGDNMVAINAKHKSLILNKIEKDKIYPIKKSYYILKAKKIINTIESSQLII